MAVDAPEHKESPPVCVICLDEGELVPTACNHLFHPKCIAIWLDTATTCPTCRATLRKPGSRSSSHGRISNMTEQYDVLNRNLNQLAFSSFQIIPNMEIPEDIICQLGTHIVERTADP